jgi:succinyl-CoA synthetase beta subunit
VPPFLPLLLPVPSFRAALTLLFARSQSVFKLRDTTQEASSEVEAAKYGLNFIKLDGSVGCLVNGAGLAMATMDVLNNYGGSPANFLDVGGGATAEAVKKAFELLLADAGVKSIFVNIFGGMCVVLSLVFLLVITDSPSLLLQYALRRHR